MESVVIKVGGMSCGGCVKNVTAALKGVAGVGEAEVSLDSGTASVSFDPAVASREDLVRAVEEAGFEVA